MQIMKRLAATAVLAVAVQSTAAAQTQFYNGDADQVNGFASTSGSNFPSMVYDNFTIGGGGLYVTGLFGQLFAGFSWTSAAWEVRSGLSAGNGGSLLFSGVNAASQVAIGSGFSLTLYHTAVNGLGGFYLAPGEYWFGLAPVGTGNNVSYLASASGTNGVNPNIDGDSFFNGPVFGYTWTKDIGGQLDFSIGVEGRLDPTSTVPEPATMTLLATGLAGLAGARRRRRTNA